MGPISKVSVISVVALLVICANAAAVDFPNVDLKDKKSVKSTFKQLTKQYKGLTLYPRFSLKGTGKYCHVRLKADSTILVDDLPLKTNLPEVRAMQIKSVAYDSKNKTVVIAGRYDGQFRLVLHIDGSGLPLAGYMIEKLFYPLSQSVRQIEIDKQNVFREAIVKMGFLAEEAPVLMQLAYYSAFLSSDFSLYTETMEGKRYLSYVTHSSSGVQYNTIKASKAEMIKRDFDEHISEYIVSPLLDGSANLDSLRSVEGIVLKFQVYYENFVSHGESGAYKVSLYLPFQVIRNFAAKQIAPLEMLRNYPLVVDGQRYVVD